MKVLNKIVLSVFCTLATALHGQNNDNTLREIWRSTDEVFGTGWITNTNLDLDRDGRKEMVLWDNQTQSYVIFEHSGQDNQFKLVAEVAEPISDPPELGIDDTSYWAKIFSDIPNPLDLNGDGKYEFYGTRISADSSQVALVIWETFGAPMDDPNQSVVLQGDPIVSNYTNGHHGLSFLGDVDGDGKLEFFSSILIDRPNNGIVGGSSANPRALFEFYELDITDWQNPVLAFQQAFESLGEIGVVWHGVVFDIDGDGLKEVVTFSWQRNWSYTFQPTSTTTWEMHRKKWASQLIPSRWHNYPVVADANRDGKLEFFMGTYFGEFYYLEIKPTIEETFSEDNCKFITDLIPTANDMMTQGMIGDHDQDGFMDFYYHSRDDSWVIDLEFNGGDLADPNNYTVYDNGITMPNGSSDLMEAYWDGSGGFDPERWQHQDLDSDGKGEYIITATQTWVTPYQSGIIIYESVVGKSTAVKNNPGNNIPSEFLLHQNYPNPFNPTSTITFDLPKTCHVNLTVFDVQGRTMAVLLDANRSAGSHTVTFDGSGLASGVYFYKIVTPEFNSTKKTLLWK